MQMSISVLRKNAQEPETTTELFTADEIRAQIKECLAQLRHNQMLFDLETESDLIDQRVFEYQALQCRYRYLQGQARARGIRALL